MTNLLFTILIGLGFTPAFAGTTPGDLRRRADHIMENCEAGLSGGRTTLNRRELERLIGLNVVLGTKLRRDFVGDGPVVTITYEGHRHWRTTVRTVRLLVPGPASTADQYWFAALTDSLRRQLGVQLYRSSSAADAGPGDEHATYVLGFVDRRPITEREAYRFFTGLSELLTATLPKASARDRINLRTLEDLTDTF